jgi:hypothetical protein
VYLREGDALVAGPGARRDGEAVTLPGEGQRRPLVRPTPYVSQEAV